LSTGRIEQGLIDLARRIAISIELPAVEEILLPTEQAASAKADAFGVMLLADGSAGPFYVSLEDTLALLYRHRPALDSGDLSPLDLVAGLERDDLPARALGLGAYNAISQCLMRQAGYRPDRSPMLDVLAPPQDARIALVGYFPPLAQRLLAQGREILVLEKNPARVPQQDGIQLTTNPADLGDRDWIICTASTLINGSLPQILAAKSVSARLHLIGPSASGLPDLLFTQAIDSVGGVYLDDADAIRASFRSDSSWGKNGRKFQLQRDDYPGVDALLERARQRGRSD
jgi:hypothetical protein